MSTNQICQKPRHTVPIRINVKSKEGYQEDVVYSSQLVSLYHLSLQTNISYYTAIEAVREGSLRSVSIENTFYVVRKPDRRTPPSNSEEVVDVSQLISAKHYARKNNFSYRKVWHIVNDGLLPSVQIGSRLYVIDRSKKLVG